MATVQTVDRERTLWQRWMLQPQRVWLRRAIFQVHLWTGIAVGLYILVVSITGSVLVFRVELSRAFTADPVVVTGTGERLTEDQLKQAALRAHPGYKVDRVFVNKKQPDTAVEIWLEGETSRRQRLFDPYTGEDLDNAIPFGISTISWLIDLHDNLLSGETGRSVNGIGGLLLTLLCLTGTVIWWPGRKAWRRSLILHRRVNWKRVTWDLHSAVGFWMVALLFMWAMTGVYLVFQTNLAPLIDYIEPYDEETFAPRRIDRILVWLPRLHFGRWAGLPTKTVWAILGVAPPVLFVTGALMWWNRVLRHGVRHSNEGV